MSIPSFLREIANQDYKNDMAKLREDPKDKEKKLKEAMDKKSIARDENKILVDLSNASSTKKELTDKLIQRNNENARFNQFRNKIFSIVIYMMNLNKIKITEDMMNAVYADDELPQPQGNNSYEAVRDGCEPAGIFRDYIEPHFRKFINTQILCSKEREEEMLIEFFKILEDHVMQSQNSDKNIDENKNSTINLNTES
jgi:hypothetical protein